jgi:hypothetical protein
MTRSTGDVESPAGGSMTYVTTYVKALAVGLTLAVVAQVAFTVCEFAVKYAISLAMNASDGGGIAGATMDIPSPLSVVAAVAGFACGFRWTLRRAQAHEVS